MSQYAKAIVAVIGVAVTTLLGLIPPDTTLWIVLTVLSAALTAAGVYLVPNTPPDGDTYDARHARTVYSSDQKSDATYYPGEGQGPGGGG